SPAPPGPPPGPGPVDPFCRAVAGLPPGTSLGIVTDAGELEDLAQMAFTAELIRPALRERGIDVVLGDTGNLRRARGGLSLCGRRIAALYRYLAFEAIFGTEAFSVMQDAETSGSVDVLNGLYGLLLQHK